MSQSPRARPPMSPRDAPARRPLGGPLLVLLLLAGYLGLILVPHGTAALRLGGVSLLWWYGGVVAPALGVIGLVALCRGGEPGGEPRTGDREADREGPSADVDAS